MSTPNRRRRAVREAGRHRQVEQTAGSHRARTGRRRARAATPGGGPRRAWRSLALIGVGALATTVGPAVPEVLDRPGLVPGDSGLAREGVPGTPSAPPSPRSTPADEAEEPSDSGTGTVEGSVEGGAGSLEGPRVPERGDGTFRVASADADAADPTSSSVGLTYTVEVEGGVGFAPSATARTVERVLDDPRGWEPVVGLDLRRTDADPDFRVLLATPATTDALCAPLETGGEVSCRNGDLVVLNAKRWKRGVPDYAGHLPQYRTYLVNHEVGHRLGYGHVECTGPGEPAPVMQQQTYGLDGCARNAWPSG